MLLSVKHTHTAMSLRRYQSPPLPLGDRVDAMLRFSQAQLAPLSIGIPLIQSSDIANRTNPNHVKAMAVLAYTTHWDGFIKNHILGHNYLKPTDPKESLAAIVAFFAPWKTLKNFFDGGTNEENINIATVQNSKGPACVLTLHVTPYNKEQSNRIAKRIAEDIIVQSNRDGNALAIWNATIDALVQSLKSQTGLAEIKQTLYRGLSMPIDSDPSDVLRRMSKVFVSTSAYIDVAKTFSKYGLGVQYPEKWVLELTVEMDVPIISVEKVLPLPWRCHLKEVETIIAPGAYYTLALNGIEKERKTRFGRPVIDKKLKVHVTTTTQPPLQVVSAGPSGTPPTSNDLWHAAKNGDPVIVEQAITAKVDLDASDVFGDTALIHASLRGYVNIVDMLMVAGADVDIQNNYRNTALILAIREGHVDIVKTLLKAKANVDLENDDGMTALMLCSKMGNVNLVKLLIEAGASVDLGGRNGRTALMWAVRSKHRDVVCALLEAGAAFGHEDKEIEYAKYLNYFEIVELLRAAGAK